MKFKGGNSARKEFYNMYNFCFVEMFGIFKYKNIFYVRTGTHTARDIYINEITNSATDAKVFIF